MVDGTTPILERAARLVWVVRADEGARATYEHNERLRRDGNDVLIGMLTAKKPLRKGPSPGRARDILLSFTGPYQFQLLTSEYGWSVPEYRDWVVQAVLRELFDAR